MTNPSPNGENGRDAKTGQFLKGWKGGPGNPHNAKVLHFRQLIQSITTDKDMEYIWNKMLSKAKAGDIVAAKMVLERLMGKPDQTVQVQGDMAEAVAAIRGGLDKLMEDPKVARLLEDRALR